jgi:hypothetical protein
MAQRQMPKALHVDDEGRRPRKRLLCEPILVDDNKDPAMLGAIEESFRALRSGQDPATILTNKPKFRDSKNDETIQLADRVMGAIGAHFDEDSTWFNEIREEGRNLGVVRFSPFPDFLQSIKSESPGKGFARTAPSRMREKTALSGATSMDPPKLLPQAFNPNIRTESKPDHPGESESWRSDRETAPVRRCG